MSKLRWSATFVALTAMAVGPLQAQEGTGVVGRWMGTLEVQGTTLRLMFEVEQGNGGLTAKLTSIDQGNAEIPVESTTATDDTVVFEIPVISGSYRGTLSADGATIEGTWTQGGNTLPLILERTDAAPPPAVRPQHPTEPLPYHVETVSFTNPNGGHLLAGTFTAPEGPGPHPAVVMISGSGPQDRDETLVGHKPFLVVSDHLTRQGIAVLRFDDRGVGESKGDFASATSADFATDVEAAVSFLKTRADVKATQIGLVGHSEGGLIAPMVAVESSDVAFIVLLAGPGISGEAILSGQQAAIMRAGGADEEAVRKTEQIQEQIYAVLREYDEDMAPEHLDPLVRRSLEGTVNDEASLAQIVPATVQQLNSPWFRYFLRHDPATTLERVRVPVLAIVGAKDLQVLPGDNMPAIERALERGGNPDVELHVLPNLNHLFQHAETGAPGEYQQIEETFAPEALELVANWILARTKAMAS